jgi:hypothetical protein
VFKIIFLCLFFVAEFCYSQGFKVRHPVPNSLTGVSRAIFETSPGVYFTAGLVTDTVNGQFAYRLAVMGLNAQGQITWVKKYGSSKFKYNSNPLIYRSYYKQGAFIYYAGCVSDSNNKQIGVLIKFNANGDTLWQKIYRDSLNDVFPQIVTGSVDGGFLITGCFQSSADQPCLLIKTDASGNELWRKRINKAAPNVSDGKAIIQDSATKKIVIGGYQYIGNANSWSTYTNILILDSLGLVLHRFNILGVNGLISDLIQTKDKKIVAVGSTYQPNNGDSFYRSSIAKFDLNSPTLSLLWNNLYIDNLSRKNAFACIREMKNGDLIIGGTYDTASNSGNFDQWLTRLVCMSPSGAIKWKRYYNYWPNVAQYNMQDLVSMEIGLNGGLIASLCSYNQAPTPYIFIKWDSLGCDTDQAWCKMVALGNDLGISPRSVNIDFFPNPSMDNINIKFSEKYNGRGILAILDVTGVEVKRLLFDEALSEYTFDVSCLKPGLYFIQIEKNGNNIYTRKFVKSN